jgi:hypothetical protein
MSGRSDAPDEDDGSLSLRPLPGDDRARVSEIDDDTVALAAIQSLAHRVDEQADVIADQREIIAGQSDRLQDLEARVAALEGDDAEVERDLADQRDELERLEALNGVLRGVNQALVSASSRAEIERTVVERLADTDLYRRTCVADIATWTGDADRWLVNDDADPPALEDGVERTDLEGTDGTTLHTADPDDDGTWAVVPVTYGRTVFGALGLETDRTEVGERERAILAELGETIGHAINAVENRQLLSADTVAALELSCTDDGSPLVEATERGGRLSLAGLVPNRDGYPVAYLRVGGDDPAAVTERLDAATEGTARLVDGSAEDGPIVWRIDGEAVLGTLVEYGANVSELTGEDGTVRFTLEMASNADLRSLVDHVEARFPDTSVLSKRERTAVTDRDRATTDVLPSGLTERQREALEAAYRAGYFDWPRETTAEEVAETLDIAASTLTAHLRKAEATLLTELFSAESRAD